MSITIRPQTAVLRTVKHWRDTGLYPFLPHITALRGIHVDTVGQSDLTSFSSCDYLSAAQHTRVVEASSEAARIWGANTPGAQLFSGYTTLHRELERSLGDLHSGSAILFPSGLHANIGVLPALAGPGDLIALDQFSHSSLVMGARLSGAEMKFYRHRDIEHLTELADVRRGRLIIVTDGVFSAEGSVASLAQLRDVAAKYDATLIFDDAHGVGALGSQGEGLMNELRSNSEQVEVLVGTMSKAFGSAGGYAVSDDQTIDLLRHAATSYQVSRGLTPATVGASLASIEFVRSSAGVQARKRLETNAALARLLLAEAGFDVGLSSSHVVPVVLGDSETTARTASKLLEGGFLVSAMVAPMVPLGRGRLRLCITESHNPEILTDFVEALSLSAGSV